MVPQPKCRYSFLFSEFLIIGSVPVVCSGVYLWKQISPPGDGRILAYVRADDRGSSRLAQLYEEACSQLVRGLGNASVFSHFQIAPSFPSLRYHLKLAGMQWGADFEVDRPAREKGG